jgi:hypothetical protein
MLVGSAMLAGTMLLFGGCSDDTDQVESGDWIDAAADLGGSDATIDTDEPDTDQRDASADVNTDDAGGDADDGSGDVSTRGWYSVAFESSLFVPDPSLFQGGWAEGCPVDLWSSAEAVDAERWWANGIGESSLLQAYPPTATAPQEGRIGLVDATGTVSALGQHGHLGAYDRQFDVTSSNVDVCGTFEALGHCVVPQGWCTKRDVEAFELVDTYLVRELPGVQPDEPTLYYNLTISSDKSGEWTELRLNLAVPGDAQSADGGELPLYTVDQLYEVNLTEHTEAYTVTDTRFANLSGWVALDTTALRETIYVSIAGKDDSGNEVHIWGHFAVDETIAYP